MVRAGISFELKLLKSALKAIKGGDYIIICAVWKIFDGDVVIWQKAGGFFVSLRGHMVVRSPLFLSDIL